MSNCTVKITNDDAIHYTWEREGIQHQGAIHITHKGAGGYFKDTFHTSGSEMMLAFVPNPRTLLCLEGVYQEVWGWRIAMCFRNSTGELVVQMTNIAPWGEECRAVRMIVQRDISNN